MPSSMAWPAKFRICSTETETVSMSLVIFDCDGVLVESEAIYLFVEMEFLAEVGLSVDRKDYIRQFMGMPQMPGNSALLK